MISEIAYNISHSSGIEPGGKAIIDPGQRQNQAQRNTASIIRLKKADTARSGNNPDWTTGTRNDVVLKSLQDEFNLINNVELKFNRDQETGQTYIKIVDRDSGKVVREIPPEELRKLAEKLDEMVGILFDKKA